MWREPRCAGTITVTSAWLLLVPGIGAQGADLNAAVTAALRTDGRGALIAISRSILFASAGPDHAEAANKAAERYRTAVNALRPQPVTTS